MRIAFSGSHRVGKSTLVERVSELLPGYETVDEPYFLLEEDGYESAEVPSVEDFEAQLERSLEALEVGQRDVLFDRCPADVFAYLLEHEDAGAFEPERWLDRAREAMRTLDLVVFVPIDEGSRIPVPAHEDRARRQAVHERLHDLLVEDVLGFEAEVLAVHGDVRSRIGQVMARIAELERRREG
ncbi:MAG TPA: ATP-binding protein [Myxococcaceae bacterium]|jgi:hypothetical protein